MESFHKETGSIRGTEVLHFSEAELSKVKSGSTSFAAVGPLSVLYLKEYNRFFLQINGWKYPLLRRLPITATAATELGDSSIRSYILPAMNGATYHLKITATPAQANALGNLETIFSNNSHFLLAGHEGKKLEASPEDKLTRSTGKTTSTGPSTMQVISDSAKSLISKVNTTIKSGTKYLTASKKKSTPKTLVTKDFKSTAKSTFKKDYFQTSEKLSQEFSKLRKENPNMSESKEFSGLKNSTGPSLYLRKDDIESLILDSRDIFTQGKYETVEEMKKKGLMGSIKEGVQNIMGRRETDAPREIKKPVELESKVVGIEHYQG